MKRIAYINANNERYNITLPNYPLKNWDGFEKAPVVHQMTKAPYQDGETLIDTVFESRQLNLEWTILADNEFQLEERRRIVTRIFNPKLGPGKIEWIQADGSTTFLIDCVPQDIIMPAGKARGITFQEVLLPFIAPKPFWYTPIQAEEYLVGFDGGLSFPFSFPINFGTVGTTINIINSGNVDTPIQIYFSGEVEDPIIKNETTGKELSIVKTINDGDILIINTKFGARSVQILSEGNYINAFEYVDPGSLFWKLIPGENIVTYTATSEGVNAKCKILYYNHYSGV